MSDATPLNFGDSDRVVTDDVHGGALPLELVDAARKEEATDPRGEVGSPRTNSPKSIEHAAAVHEEEPPATSTSLDQPDETSVARENKEEEEA